tara:strand:- start:1793 stop:2206 length:414 start_codon:yes stop_codon:yes gene_type:complete
MGKNFNHKIKVYYEDTDAGGVVYYANYLKYFERARSEVLANIGFSNLMIKNNYNALIIVKSCNIDYKKSAFLEDELNIQSFITSFSKTSFIMNQKIYRGNELIVIFKVHLVFVNMKGKPIKIPDKVLEYFKKYLTKL